MRGSGWCNGSASLESRDWGQLPYVSKAARMAYRQAGVHNPQSAFDFAEVDDLYAYRELQSLEALGLFPEGSAGALTLEGAQIELLGPTGLIIDVSGVDVIDSFISRAIRDIGLMSHLMGVQAGQGGRQDEYERHE